MTVELPTMKMDTIDIQQDGDLRRLKLEGFFSFFCYMLFLVQKFIQSLYIV